MSLFRNLFTRKTDAEIEAVWDLSEAATQPNVLLILCPTHKLPGVRSPSPFNSGINAVTCPKGHLIGLECPHCHLGVLRRGAAPGKDASEVSTTCDRCGHQENNIPSAWWNAHMPRRQ